DVVLLRVMLAENETLQRRERDFAFARLIGLFDLVLQLGCADPMFAHVAPQGRAAALALGTIKSGYRLRLSHPVFAFDQAVNRTIPARLTTFAFARVQTRSIAKERPSWDGLSAAGSADLSFYCCWAGVL